MSTKNVLVTGASGFIGTHLVRGLVARGDNVTCLVRQTSDISQLKKLSCTIAYGDTVKEAENVRTAIDGNQTVFHLAASTHSIVSRELETLNSTGFENVVEACADCPSPPTLVFVSSLAAVGPSSPTNPVTENTPRVPVSFYGKSKLACERIAEEFSARVPISIVRPPIVLGGGDRHGLDMFRLIDQLGWHFVPSFKTNYFSVIHADDLSNALIRVADSGRRLNPASPSEGIYFASADETVSYSQLGRMIGDSLGRRRTRVLRVAMPILWVFAGLNQLKARLTSTPQFLNWDKFREAKAGSWICSNEKIKNEVGFAPELPLMERLNQTSAWYRRHGWLAQQKVPALPHHRRTVSGA